MNFKANGHLQPRKSSAEEADLIVFQLSQEFDFLSPEYKVLFERSCATAFQHPIWLNRAFTQLAADLGRTPAVLLGRTSTDGRLVFVFPMLRRKIEFFDFLDAADLGVGDYNAMVVDRSVADDPVFVEQIVRALNRLTILRVRKVRSDGIGLPIGNRRALISAMAYKAHEVELSVPADSWRSRILKPAFVRFLERKRKRLSANGRIVAFEVASQPTQIQAAFEKLRHFRQERFANDPLADSRIFDFYVDIAVSGHDVGFSRTYVLSVNGNVVSVLFGICHRGRFCFTLLGFDSDNFRNVSTGLLLIEGAIDDCIRRADKIFDLTIGDEEYKRDFATQSVEMMVVWFGRRPWTLLASVAFNSLDKVTLLSRKWKRRIRLRASK